MTQLEELAQKIANTELPAPGIDLTEEQRETLSQLLEAAQQFAASVAEQIQAIIHTIVQHSSHYVWVFEYYQYHRAEHMRDYSLMQSARRQWVRLE